MSRPFEVIADLRRQLADAEAMIDVLKGAFAAHGMEVPENICALPGLVTQERAMIGALFHTYPRPAGSFFLLDTLPSRDCTKDRDANVIKVLACRIRRKLGKDAIETVHGVGYRLSSAMHARMKAAPQ